MKPDDHSQISDDSLLERFRDVLTEPAPREVEVAAIEVIGRHTARRPAVPAVYDSVFEGVPVGVRGAGPRCIAFESDDVTVNIEVISDRQLQIVGQVAPQASGTVAVHTAGAVLRGIVDDLGRFRMGGIVPGPFRIVVASGELAFETDWITL